MRGALRTVARWLLNVELLVVVAAVALCAGGIPFGVRPYCILTGSMEPALPVGALVLVDQRVTSEDVAVGDVIAFDIESEEASVCTHRVVSIDQEARELRTKGDANSSLDAAPLPFEGVRGRVVAAIPRAGALVAQLGAHWAAASCLVGTLTLGLIGLASPSKGNQRERNADDLIEHPEGARRGKRRGGPGRQGACAAAARPASAAGRDRAAQGGCEPHQGRRGVRDLRRAARDRRSACLLDG